MIESAKLDAMADRVEKVLDAGLDGYTVDDLFDLHLDALGMVGNGTVATTESAISWVEMGGSRDEANVLVDLMKDIQTRVVRAGELFGHDGAILIMKEASSGQLLAWERDCLRSMSVMLKRFESERARMVN